MILAKTIKGWTIDALEGKNATHQMKKLTPDDLKKYRDRLRLPISDRDLDRSYEETGAAPFFHPGADSPEIEYMLERRRALGGSLPRRVVRATPLKLPGDEMYDELKQGSGKNAIATTMAVVRLLKDWMKDPEIGKRIVPIAPTSTAPSAWTRCSRRQGLHPPDEVYDELKQGSGKNAIATTMALVRLLKDWMKDPEIGKRIVPIAPDEYRTFGMDSMFPSAKVYNPGGQQYESVDRKLLLSYKESAQGQMLHEGISEAGAVASATAAGSSYSTHGEHMIPFYIFYSMFGFQRTGDSIWAMADQLARGFLIGATAGRTTLTGEGLQHADGHSPLIAATNPAVVHYDPAFAYEISHIMKSGLERMYGDAAEDVIFYLTVYNEPVAQPAEPDDVDAEGILRGLHRVTGSSTEGDGPRVTLLASGVGFPWIADAARILREEWGVGADTWSVTSWNELARDAVSAEQWNLLHPGEPARTAYVTDKLRGHARPGRGGLRLHVRRPAADRALGPGRLPRARRRRLRLRRHPPGRPPLLPRRRPVGRRPGPRGPRRRRRDPPREGRRGLREVPHRRPHRRRRRQAGGRRRLTWHNLTLTRR